MVFPSPRSGHNLKSLHKKGIIPLFGWYCPFWASYLFKAASGWPRGRFLHYKRCSTPGGVCPAVSSVCTGIFAAVGAFAVSAAFFFHRFRRAGWSVRGFYGSGNELYCRTVKKALCGPFPGLFLLRRSSCGVGGDLSSWLRSDAGSYTFQRVGCLAAAADRCTKFIDAKSAWMNKMQGCPCGWYGYNAAAHLPGVI